MRITKKGKSAYNLRICPSFWPVWCRLTSSKSCKKVVVARLFHFILCRTFPSSTTYCVSLVQGFHGGEPYNQFSETLCIPSNPYFIRFSLFTLYHISSLFYIEFGDFGTKLAQDWYKKYAAKSIKFAPHKNNS